MFIHLLCPSSSIFPPQQAVRTPETNSVLLLPSCWVFTATICINEGGAWVVGEAAAGLRVRPAHQRDAGPCPRKVGRCAAGARCGRSGRGHSARGVLPRGRLSRARLLCLITRPASLRRALSLRQPALDARLSGAHCESSAGCWGRPQEGTVLARRVLAPSRFVPPRDALQVLVGDQVRACAVLAELGRWRLGCNL